ncbi:MAG: M48 family metallopeptidase [Pseudomonadota bacterium]
MAKILVIIAVLVGTVIWAGIQQGAMARALRRSSRPLQHDQLNRLIERLALAAGIERVEVRVMEQPMINGLATADGGVYLTTGLVDQYRAGRVTAPEIASVVAHELGHVALGHLHQRRLMAPLMVITNSALIAGLLRFLPLLAGLVAPLVLRLIASRLSRKGEFEADAYATALMMRAGLGARPQAAMLEKLPRLMPDIGFGAQVSWLSSHPPVEERVAAIRDNAARWAASA